MLNGLAQNVIPLHVQLVPLYVMVPTRELAVQVMDTAAALGKPYHWVVCGGVMGGENKQKEKSRLRKGVSILVATPGRLLDHLRHTAALKADLLRWLVLDEVGLCRLNQVYP
jgi:ATP-dependent RNA helicase DDX31/DBP7